jgi:hypothetical protein
VPLVRGVHSFTFELNVITCGTQSWFKLGDVLNLSTCGTQLWVKLGYVLNLSTCGTQLCVNLGCVLNLSTRGTQSSLTWIMWDNVGSCRGQKELKLS